MTAATDSGNSLATAKDLGDLTYNVTTLGALKSQEISETVGGDTDAVDFFKFNVTQANGLYLYVSSALPKISIDGITIIALSPQSPLGSKSASAALTQSTHMGT